jgi:putative transposase
MKRSKFTDEQIVAIVKEGEAGRKVADVCRANGITERTYPAGRPSTAVWSSVTCSGCGSSRTRIAA